MEYKELIKGKVYYSCCMHKKYRKRECLYYIGNDGVQTIYMQNYTPSSCTKDELLWVNKNDKKLGDKTLEIYLKYYCNGSNDGLKN